MIAKILFIFTGLYAAFHVGRFYESRLLECRTNKGKIECDWRGRPAVLDVCGFNHDCCRGAEMVDDAEVFQ